MSVWLLLPLTFDAAGWVARRATRFVTTEWWDAGMVACLGQCANLHMAQPMPLPLTVSCSSFVI